MGQQEASAAAEEEGEEEEDDDAAVSDSIRFRSGEIARRSPQFHAICNYMPVLGQARFWAEPSPNLSGRTCT